MLHPETFKMDSSVSEIGRIFLPCKHITCSMIQEEWSRKNEENSFITTKLSIRLVRPAKIQISLRFRAVWSESSLIACSFYSLRAIQRGINENPCHTGWKYRLIWVFAGHTDLIVGFAVRLLINDIHVHVRTAFAYCKIINTMHIHDNKYPSQHSL